MSENNVLTEEKKRDPLPEYFNTIEEVAEFWDTHSSADYPDAFGEEVEFEVALQLSKRGFRVRVEQNLGEQLRQVAAERGVALETLVNLWLHKLLVEATT